MKTAQFIKEFHGMRSVGRLFKLSEPVQYTKCILGKPVRYTKDNMTKHVIVSATGVAFGTQEPQTFIFPSDDEGNILDWGEIRPGSLDGEFNHEGAIRALGFNPQY